MNRATFFGTLVLCGAIFATGNETFGKVQQKELCPQSHLFLDQRQSSSEYFVILDAERKDGESISLKLEGSKIEDLQAFFKTAEKRLKRLMEKPGIAELSKLSWIVVGNIDEEELTSALTDNSALWLLVNADFKDYSSFTIDSGNRCAYIFECGIPSPKQNNLHSFWHTQFAADILEHRLSSRSEHLSASFNVKEHGFFKTPFIFENLEGRDSNLEKLSMVLLEFEFAKLKGLTQKELDDVKQFYITWLKKQSDLLKVKENETLARLYRFFDVNLVSDNVETLLQQSIACLEHLDVAHMLDAINEDLTKLSYKVSLGENADDGEQKELAALIEKFNNYMDVWKKMQSIQNVADQSKPKENQDLSARKKAEVPSVILCKERIGDDGLPYDDGEPEDDFSDVDPYYLLMLTSQDQKNIRKIITNMAEKSWYELLNEQKEMERIGAQIDRVHPLRFLGYVFSDPYLKECMNKVYRSMITAKWNRFLNGYSGRPGITQRMKEEAARDNLEKHVPGFSKAVGADPDKVMDFIRARDYEGLIIYLL